MSKNTRMTPSEAFVETLVAHGVTTVFGIAGSAYMDAMDLFPLAGIRLVSVAHEQNAAHMADGYSRVTNRHGVCIAQNGPGVTNFVTAIAAAYWAHSPVVAITPEAGSTTAGLGGFQETDQLPIFSKITRYQVHVNYALGFTQPGGSCWLTHVESLAAFDHYLDVISKIPEIDTESARELIERQLLKGPHDYIASCRRRLAEQHLPYEIGELVAMGRRLGEYRRPITEHSVDLLVINTMDDDQLAMHGLAYPLAVELRQIPLLML